MKKLFLIILFLLISILNASQHEKISIQFKWFHSFQFAGYYAAVEKGFYTDEGLDVTLKEVDLSYDFIKDVAEGKSEYGVSDSSLVVYHSQNLPVVLISQVFQHSPLVLISHRDSNITTPYEMVGKKLSYSINSSGDTPFRALILKTIGDFNEINISNFTSYQDFIDKKIDITSAYSTSQPYWLKKQGIEVNIIDPKSYGIDFYGDNFFTSLKELQEHPNRIEKMKKATLKGWEYALSHQDEIIDIILKKYAPTTKRDALEFEARGTYQMIMPDLAELGSFSKEKYARVIKTYHQLGIVDSEKIEDNFFYEKSHLLTKQEKEWLENNPMIKLAVMQYWESDSYGNNVHIDTIKLLNKYGNLNITPVKFDAWREGFKEASSGQNIHGITNISRSIEREKDFLFTQAYNFLPNHLIVKNDNNTTKSLDDLENKTIYLKEKIIAHQLVKDIAKNIKVINVKTDDEIYKKLSTSNDAIAAISYSIDRQKLKEHNLKVAKATYDQYGAVHIGVSHKYPKLQSILNKVFKLIPSDELTLLQHRVYEKNKNKNFNLTPEEEEWINKNRNITFVGDPNWLPLEAFDENGKYIGIVADYLQNIEQLVPLKFNHIQTADWSQTTKHMLKGDIDVVSEDIASLFPIKHYNPIPAYIKSPMVIVMRGEHDFVNDIEDISNKKIALIVDYGFNDAIKTAYPNQNFVYEKNADKALESLSNGKIDALILSMPKAQYLISMQGYKSVKIVGKTRVNLNLTLFVLKSKPHLHTIIQKSMRKLSNTKHLDILSRWQKVEFAKKTDYTLLFQIGGLLGLFLLGTLYWNRKLSYEITKRKTSEENQKALSNRLSLATSMISLGIWELNNMDDGESERLYEFDEEMLKIYGMPQEQRYIKENDFLAMVHPDDLPALEASTHNLFSKGGSNSLEFRITRPDGTQRTIYANAIITRDEQGIPAKLIGVNWDITELKEVENALQENKTQIQTLIDNIPLQILVTSYDGKILMVNPQTLKDHGLTKEDMQKHSMSEFYADQKEREELMNELQIKGRVDQKIIKFKYLNGSTYYMMVSILPVTYEKQNALLSIAVDLSERLEMETELSLAKEQAENANLAKSEFLANMSHEIRTPMNSVLGFSELLAKQLTDPIQKDYIDSIMRGGNTLLSIINDILDLSKIEAGKLEIILESVDIKQLALEMESIFSVKLIQKNIHFELDIDPSLPKYLLLDNTRVRQILFNLIGNAIKFTHHGSVKLGIKKILEDKEKSKINLQIYVQDSGIGIEKENLNYIFNAFEQQKGQDSQKYGGTGLGLAISKKLTVMMGGTISVESKVGIGSRFTIDLSNIPISSIEADSQQKRKLLDNILFEKATILVVDDIKDNRKLITSSLHQYNFDVIEAENGKEAIELLKNVNIDLIFMDIKMPVMDGYEATKIIKDDNQLKNIPLIALTASVMGRDLEKIKEYRFDGYLRKPVSQEDLVTQMGEFLKHKSLELLTEEEIDVSSYANLSKVIQALENKYIKTWKEIKDMGDFTLISEFGKSLEKLGTQNDINLLSHYAKELKSTCDSFDIDKIDFLMNSFLPLIEKLKTIQKAQV